MLIARDGMGRGRRGAVREVGGAVGYWRALGGGLRMGLDDPFRFRSGLYD